MLGKDDFNDVFLLIFPHFGIPYLSLLLLELCVNFHVPPRLSEGDALLRMLSELTVLESSAVIAFGRSSSRQQITLNALSDNRVKGNRSGEVTRFWSLTS